MSRPQKPFLRSIFPFFLPCFHALLSLLYSFNRTPDAVSYAHHIYLCSPVDGELVDITCGEDGCDTEGPENEDCFSIPIPDDDPFFKAQCLEFIRSAATTSDDCVLGKHKFDVCRLIFCVLNKGTSFRAPVFVKSV